MRPMGSPPPRSAEMERQLSEAYRVREEAKHKPPTPWQTDVDQLGPGWDSSAAEPADLCCDTCGAPYILFGDLEFAFGWFEGRFTWCRDCLEKLLERPD